MTTDFRDLHADAEQVRGKTTEEWRAAFAHVDTDGSGFLEGNELRPALTYALGREPTRLEMQAWVAALDLNHDGMISEEEWTSGCARAVETILQATKLEDPKSRSMLFSKQVPWGRRVVSDPAKASAAALDMGLDMANPQARPIMAEGRLASSTLDLAAGTSKLSKHTVGYSGYVPSTVRTHAHDVAQRSEQRDSFLSRTSLTATFHTAKPGYSGCVPTAGRAEIAHPASLLGATDYNRANAHVENYWAQAAKGRAAKQAGQ